MSTENGVSIRAFGRMVDQSEAAVRKAISRQSILAGFVDGKVIPTVAAAEWGKDIVNDEKGNPLAAQQVPDLALAGPEIAKIDTVPKTAPKGEEAAPVRGAVDPEPEEQATMAEAEQGGLIGEYTKKVEAERLVMVYKARTAQLEYEETKGDLVRKGAVFDALFDFSTEVRQELMNIPARCIGLIMAAETFHEGERILETEIHTVLTRLADFKRLRFTKQ
jgi:hypothetical protein